MNYEKKIFIAVGLMFIDLAILFVYIVGRMAPSHTSVIKKYTFPCRTKDIISQIKIFCASDADLKARITDTTGISSTGYTYYLDIEIKNEKRQIEYGVVLHENTNTTIRESNIKLVSAYDLINHTGGYNKAAAGINALVDYFETNFIIPFTKYQRLHFKM